jgi:putative oxidoreductase
VLLNCGGDSSSRRALGFEEISYFVMFGYLVVAGPGPVSLDPLILRATRKGRPPSDYGV